jgi:hypothetical protein
MIGFLKVLGLISQKGKIYLFFLAVSIFIFSSFFVIITGIKNAINRTVEENIGAKLPPDTIKVTPRIVPKNLFGGNIKGASITYSDYKKIRNVKGVKNVYRVMEIPFPNSVILRMFGIVGRSDMVSYGIDYSLVKDDIFRGYSFKYKVGSTNVPFIVPKGILEAYNLAYARGQGTPTVSENLLKGLTFTYYAGKSSYKTLPNYITIEGQIVGISERVPALSICMPIEAAEYLSKTIIPDYTPNYSMLYVEVVSHDYVEGIIKKLKSMGYNVETSTDKTKFVESIKGFISNITLVLISLVGIFAVISVFISIVLFVSTKVDFLSLIRMLGATRIYISVTITTLIFLLTLVISYASSMITRELFITYSSQLIDKFDVVKDFVRKDYLTLSFSDVMMPVIISTVLGVVSSFFISLRFVFKRI